MFTVDQIRDDIAPFTLDAGKCRNSTYVLDYVNQARKLLYPRGKWIGTMETEKIQAFDGILTLPNRYIRATDASYCCSPLSFDTEWHELTDNRKFGASCFRDIIDLGDNFASFRDYLVKDDDTKKLVNQPFRIKVMGEHPDDAGKVVTIQGINEVNRLHSVSVTLGSDYEKVEVATWFKHFRVASKPTTAGGVRVFIHDPNRDDFEALCSVFEAEDTSIRMRRYRAQLGYKRDAIFTLRLKKRWRPFTREDELVEFPTDAMIQACIAITSRRNKKLAEFTAALNLAIEALNAELKDDHIDTGFRIKIGGQHNSNLVV